MNRLRTRTTDRSIRYALREDLESKEPGAMIIDELGITHGTARVDMAVVNGLIHGYELKSDLDTLHRLPEQVRIYNSVLDRMTLVVGKTHLHEAIRIIPDWWGIMLAKPSSDGERIQFYSVRDAHENPDQDPVAMVSLLWRDEALQILEEENHAEGVRSKPRGSLYVRLASVLKPEILRQKIRERLLTREGWRSEKPRMSCGG